MRELDYPEIYQTVLDDLDTGVYIVDRSRRIRFWNGGAEKATRISATGRCRALSSRDHFLAAGEGSVDLDSDPEDPLNLAFRDGKPSHHERIHPP